jgi:malate dehydrogenase (oxaloacetate-decarboxylating)(NADP+)
MPKPRSAPQPALHGATILRDARVNRGTAFSPRARDALGLGGLLPPAIETPDQQVARVMDNLRRQATDLDRYVLLAALHDRSEALFYRTVLQHLGETLPLVYTPTVGLACQNFGRIFQAPRGLYVTALHAHRRPGLPEFRPHLPGTARPVCDGARPWPHQGHPAPLAAAGRGARHRRDGWVAHPRPG